MKSVLSAGTDKQLPELIKEQISIKTAEDRNWFEFLFSAVFYLTS